MARKTSLREFQQKFAERLRDLSSRKTVASKLGFQVGSDNWLVSLSDVSEVIPVPNFFEVPQTEAWFRGVSNVRGKLYSTIDFSAFQGGETINAGSERRVVLIHEKIIEGSGLLVSRMLGLRNPETFTEDGVHDTSKPWIKARFRDQSSAVWLELDLEALARETRFLEVGLIGALATA
jgi:twitching motility protein PilI